MNSIETNNLTKIYTSSFGRKNVQALTDLSLSVEGGSIFGLLGPNGAGKTTLIKILLGITFPTSGNASILNEDISNYQIKSKIGYLPENHKYPPYLTGGNVLKFFGKLNGLEGNSFEKKIDELLELVKLSKWKKIKVKAYSKGMMQRLGLAQTLINDPELIFLDEPTDGVDPIGRKEIRDVLLDLKSHSKTIFLNSHLLSEVELITDRVGILNKGKLLREGTVKEFTEKKEEYTINIQDDYSPEALSELQKDITFSKVKPSSFTIKVADIKELNKFIDFTRNKGILIKEIIPLKSTLEEMFISLIQASEKEVDK